MRVKKVDSLTIVYLVTAILRASVLFLTRNMKGLKRARELESALLVLEVIELQNTLAIPVSTSF